MSDADKAASLGFDLVSDARPQSFALAEMITCDACLRANPPTRSNCLYCAAILPATTNSPQSQSAQEPVGAPNQDGDAGVQSTDLSRASSGTKPLRVGTLNACYVVLAANQTSSPAESSLVEIAAVLHLTTTEVESAVGVGRPIPLARAATPEQATTLADKLRALGIEVDTFKEDTLHLDLPSRKVRALEFSDEGLAATLLSGGEISVNWDDLILILTGRLLIKRVEVEERRRRGRAQPLDSRELFSDEPVVDLYTKSDEAGCRIASSSFDFSCLGTEKAMTAFENFTRLIGLLKMRAPNVELDDSYRNLRPVLANVWPLEPQIRKGEWRRSGAGKVDVATVTTIDNEIQFNSYSQLRQHLKLRELEGGR